MILPSIDIGLMKERMDLISIVSRLVLITILTVSLVVLAGCVTNEDYSTSVSEPTNGTFIQDISFSDINEMDGARYKLNYRYNSSVDANYTVNVYERVNGSYEADPTETSLLVPGAETTHSGSLAPPWSSGEKRTYKLEVGRTDTGTIIDSVTITIKRGED